MEDHKATSTIHGGLEAVEWYETLDDFESLFKIQNSLGSEALDPWRIATPKLLHQELPLIDQTRQLKNPLQKFIRWVE